MGRFRVGKSGMGSGRYSAFEAAIPKANGRGRVRGCALG